MVKSVFRKLKSRVGESLLESLFAILIFTLCSVMLYTLVTASANITQIAKQEDEEYQSQLAEAEQGQGAGKSSSITLTLTKSGNDDTNKSMGKVNVKVYGDTSDGLYAYYAVPKGGG